VDVVTIVSVRVKEEGVTTVNTITDTEVEAEEGSIT
jgi:hypothetical protein